MIYRTKGKKKFRQRKLPFVIAKCAQTIDGKIATHTGDSKWITSSKARAYARRERDKFDAILVGANTVRKDDPKLNGVSKTNRVKKVVPGGDVGTPLFVNKSVIFP